MPRTPKRRRTIGILPGWLAFEGGTPDRYLSAVFRGIQTRAASRACNLLLAWGVGRAASSSRVYTAWPEVSSTSDFVPVGPWNTDGLIVMAPLLNETSSDYIQGLIARGHPVLFVAAGEKGPAIICDNGGGIYQAIHHLVGHGHRRIAFIAGDPYDPGDSAERYSAYLTALAEAGLKADPRLVAYGKHTLQGGYAAMGQILNTQADFTAVLASDDVSAFGAMRALREAGLEIPRDVAVVGFDDQRDAAAQVPPLSSVHVPLVEVGAKAVDRMLDYLEDGIPLETTRVKTWFAPRQSCGCLPEKMAITALDIQPTQGSPPQTPDLGYSDLAVFKNALVDEMLSVLPDQEPGWSTPILRPLGASLIEALFQTLHGENPRQFSESLLALLQEMEGVGADVNAFQDALSVLRHALIDYPGQWPGSSGRTVVDTLIDQARVAISESVARMDNRHQTAAEAKAYKLSILTSRLSASLDEHQTIKILNDNLPGLGIRHAAVALFEPEGDDPVARSLLISPDPDFKAPYLNYETRKFPPKGLYPPEEVLSLAIIPLIYQNEPLGYVAFDASDLNAISAVALQLAANLKAIQLHQEVLELSILDGLTGVYNRRFLELFLKKEVERCHRFQRGLSVIMLDIDQFKKYNDTFGHPAGDMVLQQVAKTLQNRQRKLDIFARYGGDEFAVILPETGEEGALVVAENFRGTVEDLYKSSHQLTLSLGVAVMQTDELSAEQLIQHADRALYMAKRTGRNKVCVYTEK